MKRFWKPEHEIELRDNVKSISEMKDFALRVIDLIEGEIGMVTGPIGSGGLGSREKNMERFERVIADRYAEGHPLFDQMPFQYKMKEFVQENGGNGMAILEDFYLPIFQSGKIKKFFFMPDWQSSMGASWEHDRAKELGIEIIYLPE